jgi:putative ABC transport system permease protein
MSSTTYSLLIAARKELLRKPRRTMIAVAVTAVGLVTIIFIRSVNDGFSRQLVDTAVHLTSGHISVMADDFLVHDTVDRYIEDADSLQRRMEERRHVTQVSPRVKFYAQLCAPKDCWHVMAFGVSPVHEISMPLLDRSLIAGEFLTEAVEDTASIVVGSGLAEVLDIDIGAQVGLIADPLKNKIGVRNYRVKGIFQTHIPEVDNSLVYIRKQSAQSLLNYRDEVSEFVLLLDEPERVPEVTASLSHDMGGLPVDVMRWDEIAPNIAQLIDLNSHTMRIILLIVFVVVAVSMMNAVLISVNERTSELGIILAVGARRRQVLWMVLAQGVTIAVSGVVIGIAAGWAIVAYFNHSGLDLARFEQGFSSFIGGTVLYPVLEMRTTVESSLAFLVLSVLVCLYPSVKAATLMPVQAIRLNR